MHRLLRINHLAILLVVAFTSVCSASSTVPSQPTDSWKITVAPKEEPGDRLIVSGVVFQGDGKTPLAGASVYVFHTDIRGYYSGDTTNSTNPRLSGTMRTNAQGKYEFETIKPGPYPSARVPAHIHYVVKAPGYKDRIFEIVFEGDEFISENMREDSRNEFGTFSIRPLEKNSEGILSCVQDIKMRQ
jgi:protocatechuate 3,4-dioxygenase, beta subunit